MMEITETQLSQLARNVLESAGQLRFPVVGECMRPVLQPGDVALVEPLGAASPRAGEVLLFVGESGQFVVHRFIAGRRHRGVLLLITKGDQAHGWDPVISDTAVLGRVSGVERAGRLLAVERLIPSARDRLRGWRQLLRRPGVERGPRR